MTKRVVNVTLRSVAALMLFSGTSLLAQVDLSGSWAARNYSDALAGCGKSNSSLVFENISE